MQTTDTEIIKVFLAVQPRLQSSNSLINIGKQTYVNDKLVWTSNDSSKYWCHPSLSNGHEAKELLHLSSRLPLWNVVHCWWRWFIEATTVHWPQSTQYTKQWTLATTIWARYQQVHSIFNLYKTIASSKTRSSVSCIFCRYGKENMLTLAL